MLIRVVEGTFDFDGDTPEPKGHEVWATKVDDFTAAALHAAGTRIDPGTWYELAQFTSLIQAADTGGEAEVFSVVSALQSGVAGPWTANIEVAEASAALMVCFSMIEHVQQLKKSADLWIRVE